MSKDIPQTIDPVQNLDWQYVLYGDDKNRTDLTKSAMHKSSLHDAQPVIAVLLGECNQKAAPYAKKGWAGTSVPTGGEELPINWSSGAEEEMMDLDERSDQQYLKRRRFKNKKRHIARRIPVTQEDGEEQLYNQEEKLAKHLPEFGHLRKFKKKYTED